MQRLRTGLAAIAKSPDFVQSLEKLRLSPIDEPQNFNEVIAAEIRQRKRLVEELRLPRL